MMEWSVSEDQAAIVTESSTEIKNTEDKGGQSKTFKKVKEILQNDGEVTITVIKKLKEIILWKRESERAKLQLSGENMATGADSGSGVELSSHNVKKENDWTNAGSLTEEEQQQINEGWFKSMKRIVENLPLTISELVMDELICILLEKERAYEKNKQWVQQMETEGGQVPLPVLPDLVLEKIFSRPFLLTKDILSSRLVCRRWWTLATKELRKRICKEFIYIPTKFGSVCYDRKFYYYGWKSDLNSDSDSDSEIVKDNHGNHFKGFLKVMKNSQLLPISAFHINWGYIKGLDDLNGLRNFFQTFAPSLTHLRLDFHPEHYAELAGGGFKKYLEGIELEKLEELSLDFGEKYLFCSWTENNRISFVSPCLNTAQNLNKFKCHSNISLPVLVKTLQKFPLPHLNTLSLSVHHLLEDKDLESLGLAVKLKRLSLKIFDIRLKPETMKGFLESQSKTLEYLKLIDPCGITKHVYEYPVMERLREFYIGNSSTNISFPGLDWNKSFPKLQELKMRNGNEYVLTESLFSSYRKSKHFGLRIIDISRGFVPKLSDCLPLIGQMFPNVHTIKISPFDFINPVVLDNFPNLKKIIFRLLCEGSREEGRNYLKNVWVFKLDFPGLAVVKDYSTRLTEVAFEMKGKDYLKCDDGTWQTYDCTAWFLKILQERLKLEQLDGELKADAEMKKPTHSNLDAETD